MTFSAFVRERWAPNLERRGVRASTLASYWSMLEKHILPFWPEIDITRITPGAVESLLNGLRSYSPKYQTNVARLLKAIFNHAVELGFLDRSPMRKSHMPICRRKEKPSWTGQEMQAIIEAAPERFRLLLAVLAFTGIRLGELLALRWCDVNFSSATLFVSRSLWKGKATPWTKTGGIRTLAMPTALCEYFCRALEHERLRWGAHGATDLVFRNEKGEPYSADYLRCTVLYPILDELGMPRGKRDCGFHRFRHSAGSIIVSKTGNLKLAQQLLGHSSISTTANIYTHIQPSELRGAVDLLQHEILDGGAGISPPEVKP